MHTKTKLTNHIIKSTLSIFLLPYYHSPQINTISFSMPPFVTLFPLFYEYSKLAYSLFFILLFCTIYKSRNTIFPHEIRLENKIMSPRLNSHPSFPFCKRVSHFESDLQILYPTFHFCNDFPVFFLAFMI